MNSVQKSLSAIKSSKFLRFCITGALNTAIDTAIYTFLIASFGVNIYLAQVCGYSAGIINSYCINRSWTFKTKGKFFGRELYAFLAVNLSVLGASLLLMSLLQSRFTLHFLLLKAITVIFTLTLGFVLNRLFVFKAK